MKITTEAWVLHAGDGSASETPTFCLEPFTFEAPTAHEVLAEPLYGCWEGNMTHALQREPIDICQQRGEACVVLGNAGVVRILTVGADVTAVRPGDMCIVFCNGQWDAHGYTRKVLAYDAPHTMGVLAKRMKLHERQVIRIAAQTPADLQKWAGFSLRYITAWANWQVAFGCWQLQMRDVDLADVTVWGWGGGVALAELLLAREQGCQTVMIASQEERLRQIAALGLTPLDRRQFQGLYFDEQRHTHDSAYRAEYRAAEGRFLEIVREQTKHQGVSIFIDNIGAPVFRATLKALARQGVVATSGWKHGMRLTVVRAIECIERHVHVFTHYARYAEGLAAVAFAETHDWLPPSMGEPYAWEDVPRLAEDYANNQTSYFPIFCVNPVT